MGSYYQLDAEEHLQQRAPHDMPSIRPLDPANEYHHTCPGQIPRVLRQYVRPYKGPW